MSGEFEPQSPAAIPVTDLFTLMETMIDQQQQHITEFRENNPPEAAEAVVAARFEGALIAFNALRRLIEVRYPAAQDE